MKQKSEYGMPPPTTRAEFEHNVYLLINEIEQHIDDKIFLANRIWSLGNSLTHLRYLPNRRVELSTIDERIRSHANMLDWIKYLPDSFLKKAVEESQDESGISQ